jgi:hypothetical protein
MPHVMLKSMYCNIIIDINKEKKKKNTFYGNAIGQIVTIVVIGKVVYRSHQMFFDISYHDQFVLNHQM